VTVSLGAGDVPPSPRPAATADDVLAGVDLSGHVSLVTGASGGLGFETARALAANGATVILAARDSVRTLAAADRIRAETGRADAAVALDLDLGELASVGRAAEEVGMRWTRLDSLIANAGVMAAPEGRTVDGFETHVGVNHLGHFVLVNRLLPLLRASAPARVVVLSSLGHRWADVDLDDLNLERARYRRFGAYGASKTANVLFAVALDAREARRGVRSFAVHPGAIQTDLTRHLTAADLAKLGGGGAGSVIGKSAAEGAATSVWAATSPDLAGLGGVYLEDCAVAPIDPTDRAHGVSSFALDPARAERLWTLSEHLVGEQARRC
jgi:NAD(P)-dependent dehydrogenase (short-subunit alcohol dehydrogenase family)